MTSLFLSKAQAQYVTIPDANFVIWLENHGYGDCLSGNQLDTTCPMVVTTTKINCGLYWIGDLTGIQYFDNLDSLICDENFLVTLPSLPNTLSHLDCNDNDLISLPALPDSMIYLNCTQNELTILPSLPPMLLT